MRLELHQKGGYQYTGRDPTPKLADTPATAVLFVQRTKSGDLIKYMRTKEETVQKLNKHGVRLVERAGSPLETILIKKDPWCKDRCKEPDCIVCRGETGSLCKQTSIVYKHTCKLCKSVGLSATYWGHTSRSMKERAKEHEAELRDRSIKSHALKHLQDHHPDLLLEEGEEDLNTKFKWELHAPCRSSFERVIL